MINRLVWGVGINDAGYPIQKEEVTGEYLPSGRQKRRTTWKCPFHAKWKTMLDRCYSPLQLKRNPSYLQAFVCEEWLTFSNFKRWMEQQDWEEKFLDKDLLVNNNKLYHPDRCVFVTRKVNSFLVTGKARRGEVLLGCHWNKSLQKYLAQCNNPLTRKTEHIGYYETQMEGHLSWKKRKHKFACQLANSEHVNSEVVKEALMNRYKNYDIYEDWLN